MEKSWGSFALRASDLCKHACSNHSRPPSLTTAKAGIMRMVAGVCQLSGLLLGERQPPTGRGRLGVLGNKSGGPFFGTGGISPDNIKPILTTCGVSFKARHNPQVDIMGWHFRSTGVALLLCSCPVRSPAGVICKIGEREA